MRALQCCVTSGAPTVDHAGREERTAFLQQMRCLVGGFMHQAWPEPSCFKALRAATHAIASGLLCRF